MSCVRLFRLAENSEERMNPYAVEEDSDRTLTRAVALWRSDDLIIPSRPKRSAPQSLVHPADHGGGGCQRLVALVLPL